MLLLLPFDALAHPGALHGRAGVPSLTIGQRVALRIGPDSVELAYVAEVPGVTLYREAREDGGPDFLARRLDELADGVSLTWNGAALPTERVDVPEAARSVEAAYVELTVRERASLPSPSGELGVRIANFPDETCYFATEAEVSGALVVEATTLARVRDGRLRDNRHGAWQKDEVGREPRFTLRPATTWERRDGWAGMPERMAGIVPDGPPIWVWALAAASLVLVAWLGRRLGARGRR